MSRNSNGPARIITQDALATLLDLMEAKDRATRQLEDHRELILSLHESGAGVEPGPLACRITYSEERRSSAGNLARILGHDVAEGLKKMMPVHARRSIRVLQWGCGGRRPPRRGKR
jgi:hypothetical protein